MLDVELRRARRSQMPLSLIMFDLDHFKEVNDRYGHLCGDAVLAAVGGRMRDVLRGSDLKCRYGGEEFAVLLPETDLAKGIEVAERLRQAVVDLDIPVAGAAARLSASFGVAELGTADVAIDQVLARADQALYRAKAEGRNRICHDAIAPERASTEASPA